MEESEDPFKDDYFKHPEGRMGLSVEKVATNEEKSQSSKEDIESLNAKYTIETFDQELEEEFSQHLGDIGEEVELEKQPPEEKKEDTEFNMEILEEPPLFGQDKGPIQEKEILPKKGEKEEKKEDTPRKSPELEHYEELEHKAERAPQTKGVTVEKVAPIELERDRTIHIEDSDEEEERTEQETLGHEEQKPHHEQKEEGDHESLKGETQMPDWLERKLQKKTLVLMDPRA